MSSLSPREGFKIQVIPEAGSYDSLRALAQTSPDFNVLVLNFERINVSSGILAKQLFLQLYFLSGLSFELGFKHNEIQHMITKIPKMLTATKGMVWEGNLQDLQSFIKCQTHALYLTDVNIGI